MSGTENAPVFPKTAFEGGRGETGAVRVQLERGAEKQRMLVAEAVRVRGQGAWCKLL